MLTSKGNNMFTVSEFHNANDISLYSKGYLGVGKDEKIFIFKEDSGEGSRFILEEPRSEFSNGKKLAFKTINGTYFYYGNNGFPMTGSLTNQSVFTIGIIF
jgi:hypothetical protein